MIYKSYDTVFSHHPKQKYKFTCEWDEIVIYAEQLSKDTGRRLPAKDSVWRVRYQEFNKGFWCVKHYVGEERAMRGVKEVQYWQHFLTAEDEE